MLALPVVLVFWICGYFWKKQGWLRTAQMDVDTGRREHDWDAINLYREKMAAMPAAKRIFHLWFI